MVIFRLLIRNSNGLPSKTRLPRSSLFWSEFRCSLASSRLLSQICDCRASEADASPDPHAFVTNPSVQEADEAVNAVHAPSSAVQPAVDSTSGHRHRIVHRRSLSNPIGRFPEMEPVKQVSMHNTPSSQVLEIPPTPELASNSVNITPLSTNIEPPTPIYPDMSMTHSSVGQTTSETASSCVDEAPDQVDRGHFRRSTIDTKAIFVGGLETSGPGGWNEQKLRAVFSKYGTVLEVRLMVPCK